MTITPEELQEDGPGTIVSKLNGPGGGVTFGSPVAIGTANADGTSTSAPHADHVHAHGDQPGGSLHADAVAGGADGFMTGADKTKLDGISAGATNTPLSTATPQAVGTAAPGSGTAASKDDHVHAHGNQLGGSLHALAVSGGDAGFFSGTDKAKLDGVATGATSTPLGSATPQSLGTAAAGSSGNASHEDHVHGHGDQLGGSLHATATTLVAGFISASDKTKLDGVATGATSTPLGSATPQSLGAAAAGSSGSASHEDHVHAHGDQLGGSLHSIATITTAGFMSSGDKTKLDGVATGAGQGFVAPIDTLINLAALAAGGLPDGTTIYVNEVEDTYVLEKATTHTADGVTVLAATGGGYWVARHHGRWDDMQGSIGQGAGSAALSIEAFRDTAFLMWFMRHDQDDALNFVYQFSHRWDPTTVVVPHLHVLPCADPAATQVARFNGYYAWSRPNYAASPLPALVGWTPFGPVDVNINPGDIYVQKIVSLGAVTPPAWARESTSLLIWFRRNGTDPGDTYTTNKGGVGTPAANLAILSTDVHYRVNKPGTETEIPT